MPLSDDWKLAEDGLKWATCYCGSAHVNVCRRCVALAALSRLKQQGERMAAFLRWQANYGSCYSGKKLMDKALEIVGAPKVCPTCGRHDTDHPCTCYYGMKREAEQRKRDAATPAQPEPPKDQQR